MKNIHVITTDKSSILGKFIDTDNLVLRNINDIPRGENVHIYITTDEDIKEGDWFIRGDEIHKCFRVHKTDIEFLTSIDSVYCGSNSFWNKEYCKKIILSTDGDLIADGVQSIDDEFLEWFIKNPSCEFVEVESFCKHGDNCPSKGAYDKQYLCDVGYKIITPSKEVINPFEIPNVLPDDVFNKSLEEDAESKYPLDIWAEEESLIRKLAFTNGAKWMQEKMYSEEDMIEFGKFCYIDAHSVNRVKTFKELLEQFKNK